MKAKDFVEVEETKFVQQLRSMWTGLQSVGAQLGFTNSEIDAAEKDYLWMKYVVERNYSVQQTAEAYTAYKNAFRRGKKTPTNEPQLPAPVSVPTAVDANIERRFRKRAAKAKANPNYTKGIGELLRIVAPQQTFDKDNAVPQFTVLFYGAKAVIKFKKKHFHAFDIYKDTGNGFHKIDRAMRSPYKDESALPEPGKSAAWRYKLVGVVSDIPVGKFSNEQTVVVYG